MKKRNKLLLYLLLFVLALLVWIPLFMLISGSLMGENEIIKNIGPVLSPDKYSGYASFPILPQAPTLEPYFELMLDTPQFFVMFWNSSIQVFPILFFHVVIGAPAAWAFSRYNFKFKKIIYSLYIVLMLMPFQVTMVSSYLVLDNMNLIDTVWAIILPSAFSTFPIFIMTRFFSAIPEALLEAAALDGCGSLRRFFYIGLNIGVPGVLSAVVLGFFEYWNAIEQPLAFLKSKTLWPLSLYLPNISIDNAGVSLVASVIMLLPALLIFLFGQEYLEQGINASGLKE